MKWLSDTVSARASCAIVLVALLALPLSPALAQTQINAPAAPSANGVKVGEGRLHPYVELQTRFDSAAGFLNKNEVGQAPQLRPELIVHVRPGARLDVPGDALQLGLNGNLDLLWYTGLLSAGSQNFSRVQGQGTVDLVFNPGGTVEFRVGDTLVRSDRAETPSVGVGVLSLYNQVRAELGIRPGGGALEIAPGASYTFEFFRPLVQGVLPDCPPTEPLCSPSAVSALNYGNVGLYLRGSYKFLPKTAIVADARYDLRDYSGGSRAARLLHGSAGVSGLVTPKISVLAKLGYANDFGAEAVRSVIATAEAAWLASETANVRVGYLRRLEPVALFGSYVDDRAYAEARALIGGRLSLHAYGSFDWLTFTDAPRRDSLVRLDVGPDYAVTRWLVVGAGYLLTTRASSASAAQTFNFARHEGYLRATFSY